MNRFIYLVAVCFFSLQCFGQKGEFKPLLGADGKPIKDTVLKPSITKTAIDTAKPGKKPFSPRKAILLSTFIPGAGQIYNHRYVEAPLAWAAVGIPAGIFFYNNSWYKKTRNAFDIKFAATEPNAPAADLSKIEPVLRNLDVSSLQNYRNEFRRNRDYSVLWFLIMWGVQVADAAVFAHLRGFDVSPDLSLQLAPIMNPEVAGQGVGIAVTLVKEPRRMWTSK